MGAELMAITATTLTADVGVSDLTIAVTSGTGFPATGASPSTPHLVIRIDKEYMLAITQPVANTIKVAQRGWGGTVAATHDLLSKVEVGNASDFPNPSPGNTVNLPPYAPSMQSIGENKTFTSDEVLAWGNQDQNFAFVKATAATIVLVAPSKTQDGVIARFTALVAVANVITATALLANGATGSPYTTATGADTKIGATLTLQAQNGLWNVVSNSGFTLT